MAEDGNGGKVNVVQHILDMHTHVAAINERSQQNTKKLDRIERKIDRHDERLRDLEDVLKGVRAVARALGWVVAAVSGVAAFAYMIWKWVKGGA